MKKTKNMIINTHEQIQYSLLSQNSVNMVQGRVLF